jgi:hypothetical protein
MSGPYKKCNECNSPGETCNYCPLEVNNEADNETNEQVPMLVTCSSDNGSVTGWVMVGI